MQNTLSPLTPQQGLITTTLTPYIPYNTNNLLSPSNATEILEPTSSKRGRPKKYLTDEERRAAIKKNAVKAQERFWSKSSVKEIEDFKEEIDDLRSTIFTLTLRLDKAFDIIEDLNDKLEDIYNNRDVA